MIGVISISKLVIVVCSDLHLCHKPPIARSAEDDWYVAMGRQLDELRHLVVSPTGEQKIPVVCCGDIYDRWNSSPELVNFSLSRLPQMYAIYGNHDTPNHDPKSLHRSAFLTLVKAGKLTLLESGHPVEIATGIQPTRLHGFPFGCPVKPLEDPHDMYLEVAVVHDFLWVNGKGYVGAPKDKRLKHCWKNLIGYDLAIYGDNHRSFEVKGKGPGSPLVFNVGGYFRRHIDEIDHKPSVGLVYSDGTIKRYYLDCSQDRFLDTKDISKAMEGIGCESFLEALADLGNSATDFTETVKRVLRRDKVSEEVKQIILRYLEVE